MPESGSVSNTALGSKYPAIGLGFDLIHTWRNRAEMLRSDVIWTHTEQEWLSAALMLLLSGRKAGPGAKHQHRGGQGAGDQDGAGGGHDMVGRQHRLLGSR